MKVHLNPAAAELPEESTILSRFARAAKGSAGKATCVIAVKNAAGKLRMVVEANSASEEDSVTTLLADAGFNDELVIDVEEVGEYSVECSVQIEEHPLFDCIYSLEEPKLRRTKVRPPEDPGPDPSWIDWYKP